MPSMKIITKHLIPNTLRLSYRRVDPVDTRNDPWREHHQLPGPRLKEPMTSWGLLLKQAQSLSELQSHPWLMVPGSSSSSQCSRSALSATLRDAVDPYRTVEKV